MGKRARERERERASEREKQRKRARILAHALARTHMRDAWDAFADTNRQTDTETLQGETHYTQTQRDKTDTERCTPATTPDQPSEQPLPTLSVLQDTYQNIPASSFYMYVYMYMYTYRETERERV
jgi:hypothetical protein